MELSAPQGGPGRKSSLVLGATVEPYRQAQAHHRAERTSVRRYRDGGYRGGLSASAVAAPVAPVRVMNLAGSASTVTDSADCLSMLARATIRISIAPTKKPAKKKHHHKKHHKPLKAMAPKQIAWRIMSWFQWKAKSQFRYLNKLWMRESSWNKYATNPWSGAYGIPQAVPGNEDVLRRS